MEQSTFQGVIAAQGQLPREVGIEIMVKSQFFYKAAYEISIARIILSDMISVS